MSQNLKKMQTKSKKEAAKDFLNSVMNTKWVDISYPVHLANISYKHKYKLQRERQKLTDLIIEVYKSINDEPKPSTIGTFSWGPANIINQFTPRKVRNLLSQDREEIVNLVLKHWDEFS